MREDEGEGEEEDMAHARQGQTTTRPPLSELNDGFGAQAEEFG